MSRRKQTVERVCVYDGTHLELDEQGYTLPCRKCEADIIRHNAWCADCRVLCEEMESRP